MTTAADFQAGVTKLVANIARMDGIVNGDASTIVHTDGGDVPSLANVAARFDAFMQDLTVTSAPGQTVSSIDLLAAIESPVNGQRADVGQVRKRGPFYFSTDNHKADCDADPGRGIYVAPVGQDGTTGAWIRDYRWVSVGWFDSVADGSTSDQTAMNRAVVMALRQRVQTVYFPYSDHEYVGQVTIPAVPFDAVAGMQTLELVGHAQPSTFFGTLPDSDFHMSTAGSIIKSSATTGGAVLTVLKNSHGGYDFSWLKLVLRNMHFRLYDNPQIAGVDAYWAQQFVTDAVMVDTGRFSTMASKPTNAAAIGIVTPGINDGALTVVNNTHVSGMYAGFELNEHTDINYSTATCCLHGYRFLGAFHASKAGRIGVFRCPYGITFDGGHGVNIGQLDIEHATAGTIDNPADPTAGNGWQLSISDINDPNNYWYGDCNWWSVEGGAGADIVFKVTGGANATWRRLGEPVVKLALYLQTGTQTIPGDGTPTPVHFSTYGSPEGGIVINGGDTTQILFVNGGTYRISSRFKFESNATGFRQIDLMYATVSFDEDIRAAVNGAPTSLRTSRILSLPPGAPVSFNLSQNSGVPLTLIGGTNSGDISIEMIRPQQI